MTNVQIHEGPSPNVLFLFTNDNPKVSTVTPNPDFQKAIRYGVDYAGLLQLAGAGRRPVARRHPDGPPGSLPASADAKYDLAQAKSWLKKSGLGHPSLKLTYPTGSPSTASPSTTPPPGCSSTSTRSGSTSTLQPQSLQVAPADVPRRHRSPRASGTGARLPGPEDYLVFGPGQLVGLRAGWTASADAAGPSVASWPTRRPPTTGVSARQADLREVPDGAEQVRARSSPLSSRRRSIVGTKGIKNLQANGLWLVDYRNLS